MSETIHILVPCGVICVFWLLYEIARRTLPKVIIMTREKEYTTYEEWIKSRPQCVQDLDREFPRGTVFNVRGKELYLIGFNESDQLIVSEIDPYKDYEGAVSHKQYLCASHVRDNTILQLRTEQVKFEITYREVKD